MTYKLIGQRNLRKYTEAKTSPTYAAAIEAQAIVDSLCGVPWKKVSAKDATMTYHTEETVDEVDGQKINGLDMNVRIRDQFDAALFCAGHSGGQHRAYANAAVYHYVLPDGTLPKLTKLTASVTSDPYNSAGARIAILTNATGEIPTNCNECRTGDAHADGVAPRTVAANGNWFPTMADCVFSATPGEGETALPSGGLQLQKHLFVFVLMESYSTVRGNWLEGCSFIRNLIQIETDAAVPGWTDGETVDTAMSVSPEYVVALDSVVPCILSGELTGVREVVVRQDGNMVMNQDGTVSPVADSSGGKAAAGLMRCFSEFLSGGGEIEEASQPGVRASGAFFSVHRGSIVLPTGGISSDVQTFVWRIRSGVIAIPFVWPNGFAEGELCLEFSNVALPDGLRFNVYLKDGYSTSMSADELKDASLYDGSGVPGNMAFLGSFESGTEAAFHVRRTGLRAATVVVSAYVDPQAVSASMSPGTVETGSLFPNVKLKG